MQEVPVHAADAPCRARAEELGARAGLCFRPDDTAASSASGSGGARDPGLPWLLVDNDGLSLGFDARERLRADLVRGRLAWRLRHGGGRGQAVARAVGLRGGRQAPTVLDATVGLGRDAAVLAALGCTVEAWERHPAVHALLEDALARADADESTRALLGDRLRLHCGDATARLAAADGAPPEVVLLDPMHPPRRGSALPRLEMQLFRALVGEDGDQAALFAAALTSGARRVAVKRPAGAPPMALPDGRAPKPASAVEGRTTRFDVYLPPRPA